jgi:hypothetical protein
MKLYDEELFLNFTSQLDQILAQARATELFNNGGNSQNLSTLNLQNIDKVVQQIVCTQNPITNDEIDRFFEMMESLEFHA